MSLESGEPRYKLSPHGKCPESKPVPQFPNRCMHNDFSVVREFVPPKCFVLSVILPMINKEQTCGGAVEYWEFLRFIDISFLMVTVQGPERKNFWSLEPISTRWTPISNY
jgi:hypothetical protein